MKIIPSRVHAVADYLIGLIIAASPWLFGFNHGGPAMWLPVFLGLGAVLYSMLTRYEGGVIPLIPMQVHLVIDTLSGLLLAVSPWVFGFSGIVWVPHLVLGLIEIGTAMLTQTSPAPISHSTEPRPMEQP